MLRHYKVCVTTPNGGEHEPIAQTDCEREAILLAHQVFERRRGVDVTVFLHEPARGFSCIARCQRRLPGWADQF